MNEGWKARGLRRLVSVIALAMVVLGLTAMPVGAASDVGSVAGVVRDGTAGSTVPTSARVSLRSYHGGQLVASWTSTVDANQRFSFANLPADPGTTYVASVVYQGVDYTSSAVKVSSEQQATADVTLYDTTTSPAAIHIANVDYVAAQVNPTQDQITMLELLTFENAGDRTYIGTHEAEPGADDPGIRPRTLRVVLPSDASNVTPRAGFQPGDVLFSTNGFVDTRPVLPGKEQLVFSYQLGYAEGVAVFADQLPYAAAAVRFFVPAINGIRYGSNILTDAGRTKIGGSSYEVLAGQNAAAGSSVEVELGGLASSSTTRLDPQILEIIGIVLAVAGILFISVLGWRQAGRRRPASIDAERATLLREVAHLDDRYAAGEVDARAYRFQRDRRKQRLVELALAHGPEAASP